MPPALFVRGDYTPEHLEAMAETVPDRAHARRLRAIAAVLKGVNRRKAAEIGGMQRQTLRDWVQRFNAEGLEGLVTRKPSGRPAKLSAGQKRELLVLLSSAAAKEEYEVTLWRLAKITEIIKVRFGVKLNEISVGRMLRSLGLIYDGSEWRRPDRNEETPAIAVPSYPHAVRVWRQGVSVHRMAWPAEPVPESACCCSGTRPIFRRT